MIAIRDAGPLTTVQDLGRRGHLRHGIPPSGPMDRFAFVVANRLAGNADGAAALECTLAGPRFEIDAACALAVTGADMPVSVNGAEAPAWTTLVLRPGDEVRVGAARSGVRSYIAFSGGLALALVLGSRSTYLRATLGGHEGRALRRADRLALEPAPIPRPWRVARRARPSYAGEQTVRVVLGPQSDRFTAAGIATFLRSAYTLLPQSDRMGARFEGERIAHSNGHDIVSDGIAAGAVQVPGDGQPIVLLADRQSTGGYTKLATVGSFDLDRIGQLRPGQSLRFAQVSVEQAHQLLFAADAALAQLPREDLS